MGSRGGASSGPGGVAASGAAAAAGAEGASAGKGSEEAVAGGLRTGGAAAGAGAGAEASEGKSGGKDSKEKGGEGGKDRDKEKGGEGSKDKKEDKKEEGGSGGGGFSFMKGILPKYFTSEWSFAQFRVPDTRSMVAFGQEPNTVISECRGRGRGGERGEGEGGLLETALFSFMPLYRCAHTSHYLCVSPAPLPLFSSLPLQLLARTAASSRPTTRREGRQ